MDNMRRQGGDETSGQSLTLEPAIFLTIIIIVEVVLMLIGLIRDQPGAMISAVAIAILAMITADVVWSLDIRLGVSASQTEEEKKDIEARQKRFEAWQRPLALAGCGLGLAVFAGWLVFKGSQAAPDWPSWAYGTLTGILFIFGVLLWWIAPRIAEGVSPSEKPLEDGNLARWIRSTSIVLWLTLPAYIGTTASVSTQILAVLNRFTQLAGVMCLLLSIELVIRSLGAIFFRRTYSLPQAPLPNATGAWILGLPGRIASGKLQRTRVPAEAGPSRLVWFGQFLERSLPRVVIGIGIIVWLATSLTQVGIGEQGIRERFGQQVGDVLGPGIHTGYPWPVDRVMRYPTKQLQLMQIGYMGELEGYRQDLIWTESHGVEEDRFVTASGRELISFDIDLYWRIDDILKYAYTCSNPEELLRSVAYKAIMLRTKATDTDTLLSRDRAELAEGLSEDIQVVCDAENLGIEIANVAIVSIHPPFEVADAYQAVVSAQVQRDTLAIQASTYREDIIPAAYAQAQTLTDEASAYSAERIAVARGEATGFKLLAAEFSNEPFLFRFRRRIEALELGLGGKRLYIVNEEFLASDGEAGLWFDLR